MGKVERKKKPITEDSNDKSHIDESEPLIVHYIAASDDHKYMIGKTVKTDDSYTFAWFKPAAAAPGAAEGQPPQTEPPVAEHKEEAKSEQKTEAAPAGAPGTVPAPPPPPPEENNVELRFLKDVTKEPKLKFFRVPRLGSYVAISLTHPTCLQEESLDKAFEAYMDVLKKREEQDKLKQQKEEEAQREKEEKLAAGEEYVEQKTEWQTFQEPPYVTANTGYFVCMDTLGQDREFSEAEKTSAVDTIKHFAMCWTAAERKILTRDKELRAVIKKKGEAFKEKEFVEINEEIEKTIEDLQNDEKTYLS
ncbi:MAG: hypothetical protein P4L67_02200 [Candidatus Pacebacteria bacterium]|nr:hypothetical protein [Candidatus Paceibacterota bacterium]